MSKLLDTISVVAELERCGVKFQPSGSNVKCACPFHPDDRASCSISVEKRTFKCHAASCGVKGDIVTFMARLLKTTRPVMEHELSERYGLKTTKAVSLELVERYHADIWNAKSLLHELYRRGITDNDIRKYRLGHHQGRITIPIMDVDGRCMNLRRYLPGAPTSEKMRNAPGCGKMRLYPVEQLSYERLIICGGEMKAIVAARLANPHGIGAVTTTGGEGSWSPEFNTALRGKHTLWVMMDIDQGGRSATTKVAGLLRGVCDDVRRVKLPLDTTEYPTGDINDWVALGNDDIIPILDAADVITDEDRVVEVKSVSLTQITSPDLVSTRVTTSTLVVAIGMSPFAIPKQVHCECDRDQAACGVCPVYAIERDHSGRVLLTVPPDSPAVLGMIGATQKELRELMRQALRIPVCKVLEMTTKSWYVAEECRVTPCVDLTNHEHGRVMLPMVSVDCQLESNAEYEVIGSVHPNPSDQRSTLLVSSAKPMTDSLSQFDPADEDLKELEWFRPEEWTVESLKKKLHHLYERLAIEQTRIFGREKMHLAMDLAYHSPLMLPIDGKRVKGWTEVLVLGDSSQGKSELAQRLMELYGVGERTDCKNASVAGLLGGLQQMGTQWFVTWGVIPMHDGRLVILEELKGAPVEVISHLTDMRSSGVAELPKIDRRRTRARTRLLAISNPRGDRQLRAFAYGVEAVRDLFGALEDVRRLDFCVMVAANQINAREIGRMQSERPDRHELPSLCLFRRLVLWAWSRDVEHIAFDVGDALTERSAELCATFSDAIPLVEAGGMRYRLARLAAALACRTYSTVDPRTVLVRRCHVDFVADMLRHEYSTPEFGYEAFSTAMRRNAELHEPDEIKRRVLQTPFPRDFIEQMLRSDTVELRDICDWCGWDREDGLQLLSFLVRARALTRDKSGYRRHADFVACLKEWLQSDDLQRVDRPKHVEEF